MAERLAALSLSEASSLLAAGEVTSRALVQACLQRISHTRELNCYVTETAEEAALARARELGEARMRIDLRAAAAGKDEAEHAGGRPSA